MRNFHLIARLASLTDAGEHIRDLASGRVYLGGRDGAFVQPRLFRCGEAVFAAPSWAIATGGHALVVDDVTLVPEALKRGDTPWVRPLAEGTYRFNLGPVAAVSRPVCFVGGGGGYHHWLFDYLARILLFDGCAEAHGLPFVLRRDNDYVGQSLAAAGIGEERIVWIEPETSCHVPAALVISNPALFGVIHPSAAEALRHRILGPSATEAGSERLYVTRADARSRRVLNEEDLLGPLRARGFAVVDPGRMGFAEQVERFARAALVVGPHGAGLSNLLWTPPGAALGELVPHAPFLMQYRNAAQSIGRAYLRLESAAADTAEPGALESDFRVDVPRFEAMLDVMERHADSVRGARAVR